MKTFTKILAVGILSLVFSSFTDIGIDNDTSQILIQPIVNTEKVVYVTPNGKCYHSTRQCCTLSHSKIVKAMTISEAERTRRPCKMCH